MLGTPLKGTLEIKTDKKANVLITSHCKTFNNKPINQTVQQVKHSLKRLYQQYILYIFTRNKSAMIIQ